MASTSGIAEQGNEASHVLRRENQRDAAEAVRSLRAMDETFDVVFVVEGQKIPAHRSWLASASRMFRKMLYGGMRESNEREVSLPMFKSRTVRATFDYIYFEDIVIGDIGFGLELLECARYCRELCLENAVFKVLVKLLHFSNCCFVLSWAESRGFSELADEAIKIIPDHFLILNTSNVLPHLSIDLMQQVVACENLKVRSELDVVEANIKWAMNHGLEVEECLFERYGFERETDNTAIIASPPTRVSDKEVFQKLLVHVCL